MIDRAKLASWFIPSNWIDKLKTNKRLVGGLSFFIWALLYAPSVNPEWAAAAQAGKALMDLFQHIGINLDATLFDAGAGFTLVGWLDWLLNYGPSNVTKKVLLAAEKPLKSGTVQKTD